MENVEPRGWPALRAAPVATATALRESYAMSRASGEQRRQVDVASDGADSKSPAERQVVVLVAEDEETIAETLAMIVEDAGYLAVVAHDGREALALARQHRPDLILTDLMMPFLSGAGLIAAVRADAAAQGQPPPPAVVITAASRARAEESGADVVIPKPFDVTSIESVMRRLLPGSSH